MNNKVELVEIGSLSIHPEIEKQGIKNEEAYKKLIPSIKEFGVLEPIKIVKEHKKLFVIHGCARFRAACYIGIKSVPVIETSAVESDILFDSILRNTTIKRSFKEVAVAATYVLERIGNSQGKKRIKVPGIDAVDNYNEASKDRYELARTVLHIDFSVSSLKRLLKIHEIDETPEGSSLRLFEQLEYGKGILPVYEIAIETDESRDRKYKRRLELQAEKRDEMKREESLKEQILISTIRSELEEKFEKEYEQRYEKEFGCKPKPKSILDLEWEEKINKLQQIRYMISIADEEIINDILSRY